MSKFDTSLPEDKFFTGGLWLDFSVFFKTQELCVFGLVWTFSSLRRKRITIFSGGRKVEKGFTFHRHDQ